MTQQQKTMLGKHSRSTETSKTLNSSKTKQQTRPEDSVLSLLMTMIPSTNVFVRKLYINLVHVSHFMVEIFFLEVYQLFVFICSKKEIQNL